MKDVKLYVRGSQVGGENYRYWFGENGAWLAKETPLWKAVLPVNPAEELNLQPVERELTLKAFWLPFDLVSRAVEFFRHVYRTCKCEAFLWIVREDATGVLALACPTQANHPAHVHAAVDHTIGGDWQKVGTWHSHPCSAFHSDGDIEDESTSDGIHIVVGHLDRVIPEFAASLVVRGERLVLDPAEIMDLAFGFDEEWLTKINPSKGGRRRLFGGDR